MYELTDRVVTYDEISEELSEEEKLPLFRGNPYKGPNALTQQPTLLQDEWRRDGYVILRDFIDHEAIRQYCMRWRFDNKSWQPNTPYMHVEEIKDLCLPRKLMDVLASLVGSEVAMNLNLTNWVSTERNLHQDDYLNPRHVNNNYAAVWFALDDIHPDSGPFEHFPGTHLWPSIRQERLFQFYEPHVATRPEWPQLTEPIVVRAIEDKLKAEGLTSEFFVPAKAGDCLIWSGTLIHRGSVPRVRGLERRALICHYSSIRHRLDMPHVGQHKDPRNYGKFFVL